MKKQLTIAAALLLTTAVAAARTFVVSVGVADYKEVNDLRLSRNDVATFNSIMRSQGAEIVTLLDSQADHASVITALRGTFAKAGPDDTMVFFFSGHGYEDGFCCYDMSLPSSRPAAAGAKPSAQARLSVTGRSRGGISYAEMQILFRNCRAGRKIVLADACFSGGLQKGEHLGVTVQSARNGDVVFMLSSKPTETSLETGDAPNSLFTHYLAEALSGRADTNADGLISVGELYDYVYRTVVAYADRIPHDQHPVLWGRFDRQMNIFKITH